MFLASTATQAYQISYEALARKSPLAVMGTQAHLSHRHASVTDLHLNRRELSPLEM